MRRALNTYASVCRSTKFDYLVLYDDDRIPQILRLLNLHLSKNLIQKWLDYVTSNLECMKEERIQFE